MFAIVTPKVVVTVGITVHDAQNPGRKTSWNESVFWPVYPRTYAQCVSIVGSIPGYGAATAHPQWEMNADGVDALDVDSP